MNEMHYETVSHSFVGNHLRSGCHECFKTDRAIHPPCAVTNNTCGLCGRILFPEYGFTEHSAGHCLRHMVGSGHCVGGTCWLVFKQHLDIPAIVGICMILGGVVVINLFSESAGH